MLFFYKGIAFNRQNFTFSSVIFNCAVKITFTSKSSVRFNYYSPLFISTCNNVIFNFDFIVV